MKWLLIIIVIFSCLLLSSCEDPNDDIPDVFIDADGNLIDPCPDDGYTAAQNYGILFFSLFWWFIVVCGFGTKNPICMAIACIMVIIAAMVMIQW